MIEQKKRFTRVVVDWNGHEDGSTAFAIRAPQARYEEINHEGGIWWDVIIKDWEQLK